MENLADKLNQEPPEILRNLKLIGSIAGELGYPVYVVGGFVRDLLLGVEDYDLDIVVEGDGIHFAKVLSHRLGVDFIKHKQFGTATLVAHDKVKVDIATARKEVYESPASLPKVTPGTVRDDLARRDFSINAMAVDISEKGFGRIVDFFKGREDLKKKIIRLLHPISFIDDPTRILRAIRFEQRFGFAMELTTRMLLKEAVHKQMLEKVHKHRLRDELVLLLKEPAVLKCIYRISALCGFAFIHRAMRVDRKTFHLLAKIQGAYTWFKEYFPHTHKVELWLLYLMVLLENLDSHTLRSVVREFAFRKYEAEAVISYKEENDRISSRLNGSLSPSQAYRFLTPLPYEALLLMLVKSNERLVVDRIKYFLLVSKGTQIHLNGEELKALGMIPGPRFKEILQELFYAKLDGKFKAKEEELHYLKSKILSKRTYTPGG